MISAAIVVPQTPLLLPGVAAGIAEVDDLRSACAAAVAWLLDRSCERFVVVSGAPATGEWPLTASAPTSGYLGTASSAATLPLGLAVGRSLLDGTTGSVALQAVAADSSAAEAAALGHQLAAGATRTALVVVGDGSACRTEKAPGHFDARAASFDAAVEAALRSGDVAALASLDVRTAAELLVAGRAAWQVLAGALAAQPVTATLEHSADPFGVWYAVARWARADEAWLSTTVHSLVDNR